MRGDPNLLISGKVTANQFRNEAWKKCFEQSDSPSESSSDIIGALFVSGRRSVITITASARRLSSESGVKGPLISRQARARGSLQLSSSPASIRLLASVCSIYTYETRNTYGGPACRSSRSYPGRPSRVLPEPLYSTLLYYILSISVSLTTSN